MFSNFGIIPHPTGDRFTENSTGKTKQKKDENGAERLIGGGNPPKIIGTIQVQVFLMILVLVSQCA